MAWLSKTMGYSFRVCSCQESQTDWPKQLHLLGSLLSGMDPTRDSPVGKSVVALRGVALATRPARLVGFILVVVVVVVVLLLATLAGGSALGRALLLATLAGGSLLGRGLLLPGRLRGLGLLLGAATDFDAGPALGLMWTCVSGPHDVRWEVAVRLADAAPGAAGMSVAGVILLAIFARGALLCLW